MNLKQIWEMIKETFKDWIEDKAPRLAAALAYYTIFSIAPLLVLIIAITGFVIGNNETIRSQIITQVQGMVGQDAAVTVEQLIDQTSQPSSGILASVIGVITLLIGATGLFGQLQDALNTIWEVKPKPDQGILGMIKGRFLSFTMVLGISFLLLVSLVVSAGLSILNNYFNDLLGGAGFIAQVVNFIVSIGVITLIFAMIFKVLPDIEIRWSDVWIGALVTALLFNLGKSLISYYLATSAASSAYGAAGSLVILLLWVYYSAQILFLGAEFTQVYARRHGSQLQPSENAIRITDQERAREGLSARKTPSESRYSDQTMIPVVGQPSIYSEPRPVGAPRNLAAGGEKSRYQPPNPASVVPVITLGSIAAVIAIQRVIRRVIRAF